MGGREGGGGGEGGGDYTQRVFEHIRRGSCSNIILNNLNKELPHIIGMYCTCNVLCINKRRVADPRSLMWIWI